MTTGMDDIDIDGEEVPAVLQKVSNEVRFNNFTTLVGTTNLVKLCSP
jgi:hypothetical protein